MVTVAQILVAAGKGARAGGDIPKQYRKIAGTSVIRRTLDATTSHPEIEQTIIVVAEGDAFISETIEGLSNIVVVTGGATRTASVRAGLRALESNPPGIVLIHDAARPFVTHDLISDLLATLTDADAAVPVLPIVDAVKSFDTQTLGDDIDRDTLRRVQTPQAFRFNKISEAMSSVVGQDFTDDIAVAKHGGLKIETVPGDSNNIKLTYPADFGTASRMLMGKIYTATGSGFDVHRITEGDSLFLCGVEIKAGFSLLGHSDADVGLHALTDAILGALSDGDIGDHFPPSDAQWKGAKSDQFLKFAAERVATRGGIINHVDVTLICEKPKVKPHRDAMRLRIAEILSLDLKRVSVKATTTEKLGFTGREEGIAAQATATVTLPNE